MQFLDLVQNTCLWFTEEGTVNLETWNNVGDRLKAQYMSEGQKCMPIFAFSWWSRLEIVWFPLPHINKDSPLLYPT
jgi:hypothetical protein